MIKEWHDEIFCLIKYMIITGFLSALMYLSKSTHHKFSDIFLIQQD
jgi:hypothetical protein